MEVEGLAKHAAARIMSLAAGGQILLSESAYTFARRGAVGADAGDIDWESHGLYSLKGVEQPVQVYEVGRVGVAPFVAPVESPKAYRIPADVAPRSANSWLLFALTICIMALAISQFFGAIHQRGEPDRGISSGAAAPKTEGMTETPPAPAPSAPAVVAAPRAPAEMTLTITSSPPGAEILLGGVSRGMSPAALRIPAQVGKHGGHARLEGYTRQLFECVVLSMDVASGAAKCEVTLAKSPAQPPDTAGPAARKKKRPKRPAAKRSRAKAVDAPTTSTPSKARYKIHTLE
jgi:hypothetical protein